VPTSTSQPYAAWTNPVIFFQSLTSSKDCRKDDVALGHLKADLGSESKTPSFSYIAPSPCDDGTATPCAPGAPAGLGPADKFLHTVVGEIKASAAYKSGGLILITADEAPQTGTGADATSCCGQPTFPNLPPPTTTTTTTTTDTTTTTTGTTTTDTTTTNTTTDTTTTAPTTPGSPPGGGQVGLLLISKWVKPNNPDPIDTFNHFSLLKGIEELFGLKQLGYAKGAGVPTWTATGVFTGPGP
jgi:phosphatidylinositol-3-phosphatase